MDKMDKEQLLDIKSAIDFYLSEKEQTRCDANAWKKMLNSSGCRKWIKRAATASNAERYDRMITRLSWMAFGIMAVDAVDIEPVAPAVYEKKQARIRYGEVFYFVQKFARGGSVITGEEYVSGQLLKLRELKKVHPKQIAFSWPAATEYWNTTHPADNMTVSQFKELYYNSERAGMDRQYIQANREWQSNEKIDRLDSQIDTMSMLTDLSDCDINNPEHLAQLKAKWPQIQLWMKVQKKLREEKEELQFEQWLQENPAELAEWQKQHPDNSTKPQNP